MKKNKLFAISASICLLIVISLQALASSQDAPPRDKACILEEFTPEQAVVWCFGEGSYCRTGHLEDCAWLIIKQ